MSVAATRRITLTAVITNIMIVVTGGAVRLTESGLGCPEWPTCNDGSVVPVSSAEVATLHQVIEFGNRLLSFVVLAVALAALAAVWRARPRRPDQVRLAVALLVGIFGQGVVGGIVVLTGLHPLLVAAHFVLSMVLIAIAVTLHDRVGAPRGPARLVIRPELRRVQHVLVTVVAAVLTLGTLVTATGPHAGEPGTPRLPLDPRLTSQFHADGVFLLLGLAVALWFGLKATDAPAAVRRAVGVLLAVSLGQGLIGYTQYFTGLPEILVGAHLLGACLVWTAAVAMWLSSVTRSPADDATSDDADRAVAQATPS